MRSLTAILCLLLALGAGAQPILDGVPPAASPLLPEEVLASAGGHFPTILKALAKRRAAEGKVTEALGAFDLVFSADGFDRAAGFYDGTALGGKVIKPLRPLGAKLYGDYSLSRGDFPIYEDSNYTNEGGTAKLGVLFSLLRDRDIDKRRFGEIDSRLALEQADLDVLLTRVGVQQRALNAYWRWVATGQQLAVYDNLLRIALQREQGLEREVDSGRRAAIFLTENRQNITRRQTLATAARRDFRIAANNLAFYLRGADGETLDPPTERLPSSQQLVELAVAQPVERPDIAATLDRRPELRILRTGAERAMQKIAAARTSCSRASTCPWSWRRVSAPSARAVFPATGRTRWSASPSACPWSAARPGDASPRPRRSWSPCARSSVASRTRWRSSCAISSWSSTWRSS
jgi:outer membrane protein TolC